MKTIPLSSRAVVRLTLQWTVLVGVTLVMGQGTSLAEDTVSVLMKQSLQDMAGKTATVLTVDYASGTASDPNVHSGSVVAYGSEGTVVTQLEGEQPVTYTKGQSWCEFPRKPHVVSGNARMLSGWRSARGTRTEREVHDPHSPPPNLSRLFPDCPWSPPLPYLDSSLLAA